MEAPLGASALMHSSTLVIAGVILVYKLAGLIELSRIATALLII
jgi:NADH:ubiquinone oxidoreductase subunit 5 (subunit L)/multisubunit Na+/H+ antiporter MnhA subunit